MGRPLGIGLLAPEMRKHSLVIYLAFAFWLISLAESRASPCGLFEKTIRTHNKKTFERQIAIQLGVSKVQIVQYFEFDNWRIFYVDPYDIDEVFLFYRGNPNHAHYLTSWSGGAAADEEASIREWALKAARGIPQELAECFAWDATRGRTQ